MTAIISTLFDDEKLIAYMKDYDVDYTVSADGFIDMTRDAMLRVPLEIDCKHIRFEKLRRTCEIETNAQSFIANAMEFVNGTLQIDRATDVGLDNLNDCDVIFLHPSLAEKQCGNVLFSGLIGEEKDISLYNTRSNLVKVDCHPWMQLQNMKKFMHKHYRNNEHNDEYTAFFAACEKAKFTP